MSARYRGRSVFCRYFSRSERLLTILSRPRRDAWSFLFARMCSVRLLIRSVRSATCTSGEPLSLSARRWVAMIWVLRSFVIDMVASAHPNRCIDSCLVVQTVTIGLSVRYPSILGMWPATGKGRARKDTRHETRDTRETPSFLVSRVSCLVSKEASLAAAGCPPPGPLELPDGVLLLGHLDRAGAQVPHLPDCLGRGQPLVDEVGSQDGPRTPLAG